MTQKHIKMLEAARDAREKALQTEHDDEMGQFQDQFNDLDTQLIERETLAENLVEADKEILRLAKPFGLTLVDGALARILVIIPDKQQSPAGILKQARRAAGRKIPKCHTKQPPLSHFLLMGMGTGISNPRGLAKFALEHGYVTRSKNFVEVTHQCLSQGDQFRRKARTIWGRTRQGQALWLSIRSKMPGKIPV